MNPKIIMGLRVLFGLFVLIFGINKFLNFLPVPEIMGDGGTLMGIYFTSGFLKIIGVFEILGGLALLTNNYIPLALTFLMAIMFNALLFHLLHDPAGIGGAVLGVLLNSILIWVNRHRFKELLSA